MRNAQTVGNKRAGGRVAAMALSVLCTWRLPVALGLGTGSAVISSHAVSVVIALAAYLLLERGFAAEDKRLKLYAYATGLVFGAFTLIGERLLAHGAFADFAWLSALDWLMTLALLTLLYGSAVVTLFGAANAWRDREALCAKESLLSKLLGNGFIAFALFLLFWIPAFLACYPGTFVADSVTQFYQYMDETFTTHHPLLHTLFLGFCMMTGIDVDPEGYAGTGLVIYGVVQMTLMAAILGYACYWMRRRRVPTWLRACLTAFFALFPVYSLWSFAAQKDVLFAGFALLFTMQLADICLDDMKLFRSPLRIAAFIITAAVMSLLRNNGCYALCLIVPLALACMKGVRLRAAALLIGCLGCYILANAGLVYLTYAESGSVVEMLSVPLQQIARATRDDPDCLSAEDSELIDTLYSGELPSDYYYEPLADPVKWAVDNELLEENLPATLSLWARLGATHIKSYSEAFFVQNLPYYLPGAPALYRFDLGINQIDLYPIYESSRLPRLRAIYDEYDKTLSLFGLPGTRLLSDTAFYVWMALFSFAYALYRGQKQWLMAFGFLLALWVTCLLGPVALMRYMLGVFYAVPVLLAAMLSPKPASA